MRFLHEMLLVDGGLEYLYTCTASHCELETYQSWLLSGG